MDPKTEDLPVLEELEKTVVRFWKEHREMTDHVVRRAYDGVMQHYRSIVRGHEPKPCTEKGLDLEAFNAVLATAETLRTSGPPPNKHVVESGPVPAEKLIDCLRQLSKSVERHTVFQGRQGYLGFISEYL